MSESTELVEDLTCRVEIGINNFLFEDDGSTAIKSPQVKEVVEQDYKVMQFCFISSSPARMIGASLMDMDCSNDRSLSHGYGLLINWLGKLFILGIKALVKLSSGKIVAFSNFSCCGGKTQKKRKEI
jgi:hypothetical protein